MAKVLIMSLAFTIFGHNRELLPLVSFIQQLQSYLELNLHVIPVNKQLNHFSLNPLSFTY